MKKAHYVSEYTFFINQYAAEHPEVVEDHQWGGSMFWNRKVDQAEVNKANEDYLPDDNCGSYPAGGRVNSLLTKDPGDSKDG